MHRSPFPPFSLALLAGICLWLGCGALGDPGNEPAGWQNLPAIGVSPWLKLDLDPDPYNTKPFIRDVDDNLFDGREPTVVREGDIYRMWFEMNGGIWHTESDDGVTWDPAEPVDIAGLRNPAGAPCVLWDDEGLHMWYVEDAGRAIGYARPLSADGLSWEGEPTDLVPEMDWEGGSPGRLGSPCVITDLDDSGASIYSMWYHGGRRNGEKAIGYAYSTDGIHWVRRDALGRTDLDGGTDVAPTLVADQPWETGTVWSPCVIRDDSSQRPLYKMYYTGGVLRPALQLLNLDNTSIGFAGSPDGMTWEKIRPGINPVIGEKFILDLAGFIKAHCPEGPICEALADFFSGISDRIIYDEYGPWVIRDDFEGEIEYKMWLVQVDLINFLLPPMFEQGLSIAASPPRDIE